MKNLTLGILLIAIGLAGFLMYKRRGQPRSAPLHNTITAGTTADFPPFSFRDSSNDIVGFDIDIAREVARRLDKNIEFQDMPFDSLIPQLKNGTIHIIAAGISATPERKQSVLFTDPYLTGNPLVVLSKKDSGIDTFKDIKNKKARWWTSITKSDQKILALEETPFSAILSDRYPRVEMKCAMK
jgi:polar amino acid transport system substrate-binding protein